VAVDVLNEPEGLAQLEKLGVRKVPVVARGGRYVFGQNLEDVAEFVGLEGTGHTPLPPSQLIDKWTNVLRASQRFLRQMPQDRINERVIPNRDRPIRLLGHHVFRIGEAFLESAINGVEYSAGLANLPPADGAYASGSEIAKYGESIIDRLQQWWDTLADRSCAQPLKTYYGVQPMHQVFERSTWHSAQHARQLIAVLERFGVEPDGRLTKEDLAGLPLPERLWE